MLLTIDIGNSNIVLGFFIGKHLKRVVRMESSLDLNVSAYYKRLKKIFNRYKISVTDIHSIMAASVVPKLSKIFYAAVKKNIKASFLEVNRKLHTGITLEVDKPAQVGADRIVNAAAISHINKQSSIIVDFGTATTFDCILSGGVYIGGVIAPGPDISAKALHAYTAQLPLVKIRKISKIIGKNTVACMQSGLYYGYKGLITEILTNLKNNMPSNVQVYATGGLGEFWAGQVPGIQKVYPHLTLEGLRVLWDYNVERRITR
ncbi:MAG: type III pantothenate kinase [bacterium]